MKIVGSHAGISVGEDGATHQCCEDIALMRSIPGMVILNPADHYEMLAAVKAAAEHVGPVYIRLGRLAVESFTNNDDYKFEIGKGITLRDGKDITIIATGLMVGEAVKAVKALEAAGIDARLIDMHTIKPLDTELVLKAAQETGRIVTVEEHNVMGGLGEAVASYLSEVCPTPVTKIGGQRRVRPLRPRRGFAEGVRPVRGKHRSHCEKSPGQVTRPEGCRSARRPSFLPRERRTPWNVPSARRFWGTVPPSPALNREELGYDYPQEKTFAKLQACLANPAHAIFVAERGGRGGGATSTWRSTTSSMPATW